MISVYFFKIQNVLQVILLSKNIGVSNLKFCEKKAEIVSPLVALEMSTTLVPF